MKKYRIAMIASCMTINGISTVIKNYCENIDLKRFSITVIAGKPINELYRTEFEKLGIEVIELPERKENTVQYYVELVRTFRKKRIDVVHVHGNSATISLELLLAKIAGVKVRIAHIHNSKCEHEKANMLLLPLLKLTCTNGMACSSLAGEWIFGKDNFYVLPNGFKTSRFKFCSVDRDIVRNQYKIADKYVIGSVGRMNDQKNQQFLLDIFTEIAAKNERAVLMMVGDGPNYKMIEQEAQRHKFSERIVLTGECQHTEKTYSAFDVFVMPSKYEGLGIVALEAQISGLPCIVSDNVPKDVMLSDNIQFVSLCDKKKWIESVLAQERFDQSSREEFYEANRSSIMKYDIDNDVKLLERQYLTYLNMVS